MKYIDPMGYEEEEEVYIFYTSGEESDFTSQATWKQEKLELEGKDVTMIEVTDADDFVDGWNDMQDDINGVYIYSHSNPTTLIFLEGSNTEAISINGKNSKGNKIKSIDELDSKTIKNVEIYGCNAGNYLAYQEAGENFASALSKKVKDGAVYGYDGNVGFRDPLWQILRTDAYDRLSNDQTSYKGIAKKQHIYKITPRGKLTYYNGEYMVYGFYPMTSLSPCEEDQ